jgi:PilZ domain
MTEATSPQPNRRRWRRLKAKTSIKIIMFRGTSGLGYNVARSVLDLSQTGVRLLVKEPLPANMEVLVQLESMSHRRPVQIRAKVIWCRPMADGSHCVGVDFGSPMPHADITQFITS